MDQYLLTHTKHQKFADCKEFTWSTEEDQLNDIFNAIKLREEDTLDDRFFDRTQILDVGNTVKHLSLMKTKTIYKVLDPMPKGVLHHLHADCNEDIDFVALWWDVDQEACTGLSGRLPQQGPRPVVLRNCRRGRTGQVADDQGGALEIFY